MDLDMAVKDSIGGWKDSAFVYKSPRGCSTLKYLAGKSWTSLTSSFGLKYETCPIPEVYKFCILMFNAY